MDQNSKPSTAYGAGAIAQKFINSKLTPLIIFTSIFLGIAAVILLPREEEPQIIVPMVDVMVAMPGFTAKEVEERATRPMEKLLWEIPGVEYIYSTTRPGESLVIVRFKVGEDLERSLVRLNQKLQSNFDRIPHGVSFPIVKPRSIDDVPILALTFHGESSSHYDLRRIAVEVEDALKSVPNVSETTIIGGVQRTVNVQLDPVKLASRGLSAPGIVPMLQQANRQFRAGAVTAQNSEIVVETGGFLQSASDVANVIVGVADGRPIYLRDVAEVVDGPKEADQYVFFGSAAGSGIEPAVTLTIAKRPQTNAISIAEHVLEKLEILRGAVVPANVSISVTRHYGETAAEKSNELLWHMLIAVVSVSLLILFMLGWRESIIVALAIPSTLALTLLVFYLTGFTLNRITLFALIFSIGILVDDAIVVVENIERHFHLAGGSRKRSLSEIAVQAVQEVGNPTVLATFAVIAAVLPMAFVGGLMGPYMRPIPIGASAAMLFSLLIAFIVTPWAAVRVLEWKRKPGNASAADANAKEDYLTRLYRRVMVPLVGSPGHSYVFLASITLVLVATCSFVVLGWVKVKMLPFDNKSEFQIILNMPEGSSLEQTAAVAREMAAVVAKEPEVVDYQLYVGTAAPYNFNGLVRHYFLRRGASSADIQVALRPKAERSAQSHDIAVRVRPAVAAIAARHGARVAVAEVPPGPPVLQTIVAEVFGPTAEIRSALAEKVKDLFRATKGVVDIDWYAEADQKRLRFVIDAEKAALHGISAETISQTLRLAVGGASIDLLHRPSEKEDVNIVLELPRAERSNVEQLLALQIRSGDGNRLPEPGAMRTNLPPLVPLRELVRVEETIVEKSIYRKNLMPVSYVVADVAGEVESPVYPILEMTGQIAGLTIDIEGGSPKMQEVFHVRQPLSDLHPAIKWDGEWHITIEVFRDLGAAFGAVLILIYALMVGWFQSFLTPLIVMAAIPFSLIGILPAHAAMGVFFSATSMIGFMAGAGIVIRNSIILVDFIEQRLREGSDIRQAVVDAGAIRFRPMLLTALAVVVGGAVMLFDPIFQGLAVSLMFGEIASLLISRMAVPVLYYLAHARDHQRFVAA